MILTPTTPNLPPLPVLQGADELDLTLEVFTHSSLNPDPNQLKGAFGNADRLNALGQQALTFAATRFYFLHKPQLTAQQITNKVNDLIGGPRIIEWLDAYPNFKSRLTISPGLDSMNIFANISEASKYFQTYIGALLYCRGPQVVDSWIFSLLNLSDGVKVEDDDQMMQDSSPLGSSFDPSPPDYQPPPGPPPSSFPNQNTSGTGSSSIRMDLISLAFVNETASKKRANIDYHAERSGLDHTPSWTVRCLIDGVERGRGVSSRQKTAKEEAARHAFVAMGWP